MRILIFAVLCAGSLTTTACGMRGPLYLPEVPPVASEADHTKPSDTTPR